MKGVKRQVIQVVLLFGQSLVIVNKFNEIQKIRAPKLIKMYTFFYDYFFIFNRGHTFMYIYFFY